METVLHSLRPRRECEYDNIIEAINGPNEVREIDCNIVHKKTTNIKAIYTVSRYLFVPKIF